MKLSVGRFALTGKIEFLPYVKVLNANPPSIVCRYAPVKFTHTNLHSSDKLEDIVFVKHLLHSLSNNPASWKITFLQEIFLYWRINTGMLA